MAKKESRQEYQFLEISLFYITNFMHCSGVFIVELKKSKCWPGCRSFKEQPFNSFMTEVPIIQNKFAEQINGLMAV